MTYIAALDVGTTTVRCFIVNERCEIKGLATDLVDVLNPKPGYFEIEPEALWQKIVKVIINAIKNAQLRPSQISCLGVCCQRCTFLTWNHRTKVYYHNFIIWKDLRSNSFVDQWNNGFVRKALNTVSYFLYLITFSKRFLAASISKLMNGQVTPRLLHEIQNNRTLQEALENKEARIEFLDSWILYKLRSGDGLEPNIEHISDITSCTATGLFDPFILGWSKMIASLFKIDISLLPKIVDNSYKDFGCVHPDCFKQHNIEEWRGVHIPITASMSDQTAAIWGSNCLKAGDVKITLGTGAFLNLITGTQCYASLLGMYPLVAWQFDSEKGYNTTYCMEGAVHDMGTAIEFAKSVGLITDVAESAAVAESVEDSGGVFFVSAFSGLGPPINDDKATSGFLGITPSTRKSHLIRAILESIVYRLVQLCEIAQNETGFQLKILKLDGGVAHNDFVCQLLADITGIPVERPKILESSIIGISSVAGLNYGIWKNADIRKFRQIERTFQPNYKKQHSLKTLMEMWQKAVRRFGNWYS